MSRSETLRRTILRYGPSMQPDIPWANAVAVLGALAEVESAFGELAVPRHEPAYDWGGKYFDADLWRKWGAMAACSYSSFQIMFPVACELGCDRNRFPYDLNDDEVAIHWVIAFIKKRILEKGAVTLEQFADAYNSGNFKDAIVPERYISKFIEAYASVVEKRNLKVEV